MDKYKVNGICTILDIMCTSDCTRCEAPEDDALGRVFICPHHCCLYGGNACRGFEECDQ